LILTGFLGSGKTTIMNHILLNQRDKKFAIIENEVGEVGVDQDLLEGRIERNGTEVILMPNGCLCCRVRGDLVSALKKFCDSKTRAHLDGIIIECSGSFLLGLLVWA
jgi:G3E family GTPase